MAMAATKSPIWGIFDNCVNFFTDVAPATSAATHFGEQFLH
jgi:hypothetical protein